MKTRIDRVEISTALPENRMKQNILDARKHCVTPISQLPDWREGRVATIIGGGPSLSKNLDDLRKEKFTIACGSVHDYLMEQQIAPAYSLICDPDPIMANYIKKIGPGTVYLVASQCDKAVFSMLQHRKTFLWDCLGPTEFNEEMFDKERVNAIPGGCTVGTRAILCAIGMGFRRIRLYGMDCCLDGEKHHAYEFNNPELEKLGELWTIQLDNSDKIFTVSGYMMAQIQDFREILKTYGSALSLEIVGDGVLAELARLANIEAEKQLSEIKNGDKN